MADRFDLINFSKSVTTTLGGVTANVNIDANTLFVDGTNNRVGIGTAAPGFDLDVRNATNTTFHIMGNTSGVRLGASADTPVAGAGYLGTYSNNPIVFGTNNAERMRIDSNGRVTTPAQPAFHATSSNAPGTNTEWVFNGTAFNRGSHFNTTTGRFTAPVAGVYYFYVYGLPANGDNTDIRISLRVNATTYSSARFIITKNFNSWQTTYGNVVMSLAVNDFVSPWIDQAGAGFHTDNGFTGFGGFLLG